MDSNRFLHYYEQVEESTTFNELRDIVSAFFHDMYLEELAKEERKHME